MTITGEPTTGTDSILAPPVEVSTVAELADLREAVRDFLAAKSDEAQVRAAMDTPTGYDPAVWTQLAEQLSLPGLALPVEYGGDGFSPVELAVVLEEMGRALLPSPFLASVVMAAGALLAAGDDVALAAHLPGIAAGTTTATLAVVEADGVWGVDDLKTTATAVEEGWVLTGAKTFALNGTTADLILVTAQADGGPSLFAVAADAVGLTRTALNTLDQTRPLAAIELVDVPATLVGVVGGAAEVLDQVLDRATTALAAEQVGAARACLEASSSYARERVQFGRPIGTFQAVKHKCADMLVRVELAAAAAQEAANALAGIEGSADPSIAAAVAHAVCSEAFMFVAMENIQVHGGIGFTWEHPAHLYFRRAKSSQLLFGGPAVYYERLLQRAGL
ncbi:MAG: putative acyl-CoA dehydrogenase [Pseudonocardiales bacterium]|nr:putative acyl-CoA dehydrogenase [Pseudonocardiales bacterium]